MTDHHQPSASDTQTVQLAFLPADPHTADPATINDLRLAVVAALQRDGYHVQAPYTGQRGGDVLDVLMHVAQQVRDNKEVLVALCGLVTPIITYLLREHDTRAANEPAASQPVKVSMVVDGATLNIEAPDAATAAELAKEFQAAHPQVAARVTLHSNVKVHVHVPAKRKQRRR